MAIPEGFHTMTPYFGLEGAAEAIALYEKAFGAELTYRQDREDGTVRHSQIRIGNSHMMICDVPPDYPGMKSIQAYGGSPINLFLYVEDADALFARCLGAGMSEEMAMSDQPYGRTGGVKDPFGLVWWITTAPE